MKNVLTDLSNIQIELENLFNIIPEDIKQDCHDLRLKKSNILSLELNYLENSLGIKLPESFKNIALKYDLGDLTLGGIWFGSNENYAKYILRENSKARNLVWWGTGDRPVNYLLVANSDGYLILLNTQTEEILAFSRSDSYDKAQLIANSFDLFLRAAATIYISARRRNNNTEELLTSITKLLGCSINSDFWREIIN
jgi:SMI1-KNR4 cell-wall